MAITELADSRIPARRSQAPAHSLPHSGCARRPRLSGVGIRLYTQLSSSLFTKPSIKIEGFVLYIPGNNYVIEITPYIAPIVKRLAINTPIPMAGRAVFNLMSKMAAMSAPVHAPIPGNGIGIATNNINPINTPRRRRVPFDFAFSSNLSAILPRRLLIFRIKSKILRMNMIINGTGRTFPIMHMIELMGIDSPIAKTPSGIVVLGPPMPGISEIINTIKHLPRYESPNMFCKNPCTASANYQTSGNRSVFSESVSLVSYASAQFDYTVAQRGSILEFEQLRGGSHFLFQPFYLFFQFTLCKLDASGNHRTFSL